MQYRHIERMCRREWQTSGIQEVPDSKTMKKATLAHIILGTLSILSVITFSSAGNRLSDEYRPLARIQSPVRLLTDYLPRHYTVPLTLSGSIAREIKAVLDTMKISMVQYTEHFNRKKGFQLLITNSDYTTRTRDLLAGILNPVDMTDIVLRTILEYQKKETLIRLQNETVITTSQEKKSGMLTRYTLVPKGERFCYRYTDRGAFIHESWLTKLQVAIDAHTMLAHELTLRKHTRTFSTYQENKPEPSVSEYVYRFEYTMVNNVPVPSRLTLLIDSVKTLTLAAAYVSHERFILFDQREITYFLPDESPSHLTIRYGAYQFSNAQKVSNPFTSGKYSKKLKRAAELSRKAIEALDTGRIQKAVNLFQTIVDHYPGTPQAVEAQKLLSGLPDGL